MAFTLYDATIVEAKLALASLDNILTIAEKHENAAKFPEARLYEDMKPLTFQVHAATRFAEKIVARLSGRESVEFEDEIVTFDDMHSRIAKAQELLEKADKDVVNKQGEEVKDTELPSAGRMELSGKAFAMGAAIPNLNFHLSMAYAVLRKEGVPLGKKDYITPFVGEYILKM
ncbi:hypothetical protein FHETE_1953 [Fusarium heterosporum]|uniref:Uncharacterized protein n=1 Tax=Fusarium heterosporum TaxID=42747 RepID=A0A8H5TTH1_FUSHE|nr:hypothetical protein FHETE_1953 [Fusarium heterosporum]